MRKRWLAVCLLLTLFFDGVLVYSVLGDRVVYQNEYGRLEVYPTESRELITQTQFCNATTFQDGVYDFVFSFDFKLSNTGVWLWKNTSYNVEVLEFGWVNKTYMVYDIQSYQSISEPEEVDLGDIPSENYMVGVGSSDYSDIVVGREIVIGYDSVEWIVQGESAVFTYMVWGVVGVYPEMRYKFDWVSVKDKFSYVELEGRHHYYVTGVEFTEDVTKHVKWQYDVPMGSDGKWDLHIKNSSSPIGEWVATLDPWWDSSWGYSKRITISDKQEDWQSLLVVGKDWTGGDIDVDCEGNCQDDFGDLRFTNESNTSTIPYFIRNTSSGNRTYIYLNNTHNETNLYMYYSTAGTTANISNGNTTFDFFDDFNDGSINASLWDTAYNTPGVDFDEYGGYMNVGISAKSGGVKTDVTWNYPIRSICRVKYPTGDPDAYAYYGFRGGASDNGVVLGGFSAPAGATDWQCYAHDGSFQSIRYGTPTSDWVYENITVVQSSLQDFSFSLDRSVQTYTLSAGSQKHIMYGDDGTTTYDWTALAKWRNAHPYPNWSSFGEEMATPNNAPLNANPVPSDGGTNIALQLTRLTIHVSDADGDWLNTTVWFKSDSDSSWQNISYNATNGDGWVNASINAVESYSKAYTWLVNTTDGIDWDNDTYTFTTIRYYPDVCWVYPREGWDNSTAYALFQINSTGMQYNATPKRVNVTFQWRQQLYTGWSGYANLHAGVFNRNYTNKFIDAGCRIGRWATHKCSYANSSYGFRVLWNDGMAPNVYLGSLYVNFTTSSDPNDIFESGVDEVVAETQVNTLSLDSGLMAFGLLIVLWLCIVYVHSNYVSIPFILGCVQLILGLSFAWSVGEGSMLFMPVAVGCLGFLFLGMYKLYRGIGI